MYVWCSVGHPPPPPTNGYGCTVSSGSSGPPSPCGPWWSPPTVACSGGRCMYVCITAYIAKVPGIPKFSTSSLSLRRHLATGRAQRGPFLTALEFATDVSTKQAVFHIFDPSQYGEILINFAYIQTHVGYQWRHKMLCVPNIKPSVLLRLGIHNFLPIPKYYHIMVDRSSTKEF